MSVILIVDDVPAMADQYAFDLERLAGHRTLTAGGGKEALELLVREPVECMILDLEMPGMDGFEVLRAMRRAGHETPVIVYTGTGSYERCVQAVKLGATSFIDKSEPMESVVREVGNVLERSRLVTEVTTLRSRLGEESALIGDSPTLRLLRSSLKRVAPIPSPVLIQGESGTGKELVARELHDKSGRTGPFLALNCAALPENLVESELFGHEAGAFTGAERIRKGAFETATGGTLFLDEIGELPLTAQAKLLRVLEEDTVTRLGSSKALPVDTRILAATNRNLEREVTGGRFRRDLLYRLNVHSLMVPPLRDRLADVPVLVAHFLDLLSRRLGRPRKTVTAGALERLASYGWEKNNVRELRNIVERLIIADESGEIDAADVPADIGSGSDFGLDHPDGTLKEQKLLAERAIVLAALDRHSWHITRTAAALGLADHSSLLKIMRRQNLKRP